MTGRPGGAFRRGAPNRSRGPTSAPYDGSGTNSEAQAGFPDARLAHGGDDLAVTRGGLLESPAQHLHLGLAPDISREAAGGGGLQTGAHTSDPLEFVSFDRLVETLDANGPDGFHIDVAFHQAESIQREEHRAKGPPLAPYGPRDVSSAPPPCNPFGSRFRWNGPRPLPSSAPHELDRDAFLASDLVPVTIYRLLHPERSIAGPHAMVLVRQRRTEERHDAVSHDLGHRAFVMVNGLHHVLEHGIENLPAVLRIAISKELHGALQICEENGQKFPFTLSCVLRREDPLSGVPGCVGFGDREFGEAAEVASLTLWPHWRQNRALSGSSVPQARHM